MRNTVWCLFLVVPMLLSASRTTAQPIDHSGTLNANETWKTGETHRLTGTFTIPQNRKLVIQKGVTVVVQVTSIGNGLTAFNIYGEIDFQGTADQPIVFTPTQDDGITPDPTPTYGKWLGIVLISDPNTQALGGRFTGEKASGIVVRGAFFGLDLACAGFADKTIALSNITITSMSASGLRTSVCRLQIKTMTISHTAQSNAFDGDKQGIFALNSYVDLEDVIVESTEYADGIRYNRSSGLLKNVTVNNSGVSGIDLQGGGLLELQGVTVDGSKGNGMWLRDWASGVLKASNVTIKNVKGHGLRVGRSNSIGVQSEDLDVDGITITTTGSIGIWTENIRGTIANLALSGSGEHGIFATNSALVVENGTIVCGQGLTSQTGIVLLNRGSLDVRQLYIDQCDRGVYHAANDQQGTSVSVRRTEIRRYLDFGIQIQGQINAKNYLENNLLHSPRAENGAAIRIDAPYVQSPNVIAQIRFNTLDGTGDGTKNRYGIFVSGTLAGESGLVANLITNFSMAGIHYPAAIEPFIVYNNVFVSCAYQRVAQQTTCATLQTNLTLDPKYRDLAGRNFRLSNDTPAELFTTVPEAVTPPLEGQLAVDIDGNPRVKRWDIGAYEVPVIKSVSPSSGKQGELVQLDLTGFNFIPGETTVTIQLPNGTVDALITNNGKIDIQQNGNATPTPDTIAYPVTIGQTALPGERFIVVKNPSGPSASSTPTGGFSVEGIVPPIDVTTPDVSIDVEPDGTTVDNVTADDVAPNEDATPGDDTAPGDDVAPNEDTAPGDDVTPNEDTQVADQTQPGDDATQPGDDATQPGDDATQPGDDATQPGDDATQPGDDATQPGDDTGTPQADTRDDGSSGGTTKLSGKGGGGGCAQAGGSAPLLGLWLLLLVALGWWRRERSIS